MRNVRIFIALAAVAAVLVALAVTYNAVLEADAARLSPLKDKVLEYIAANHADAEVFITGVTFTYAGGGTFIGGGWVLALSGGTDSCTATADFSVARIQQGAAIPHRILWYGTISNGTVAETGYTHAV